MTERRRQLGWHWLWGDAELEAIPKRSSLSAAAQLHPQEFPFSVEYIPYMATEVPLALTAPLRARTTTLPSLARYRRFCSFPSLIVYSSQTLAIYQNTNDTF